MSESTPSTNGHVPATNGKAAGPVPANGDGRDNRGRFAAGNKGGSGNPFARRTAALRDAFLKAVTPDDIRAVARKLLEKALAGDVAAAKLLLGYVLGKPAPVVNPDDLDWNEIQQRLRCPDFATGFQKIQDNARPELLVGFDRFWKVVQDHQLADAVMKPAPKKAGGSSRGRRAAEMLTRGFRNGRSSPTVTKRS